MGLAEGKGTLDTLARISRRGSLPQWLAQLHWEVDVTGSQVLYGMLDSLARIDLLGNV